LRKHRPPPNQRQKSEIKNQHADARNEKFARQQNFQEIHRNDRRRSLPLAALAPLFSLPGTRWHSLQKGPATSQLAQVHEARDIVPLAPDADFAHTAALVDLLDAVVTVDTSIAHLAGALGKPSYVLLPFAPDWRWGIAGSRTPWYPTARLFRQPSIGDWTSVVASLRDTLAAG